MAKKTSQPKGRSSKKSLKARDLPKAEQGSKKKMKSRKSPGIPPCI